MQDSAMVIALWAAIVGCYAMCIGFIKWVVSKANGHNHLVSKEVCEVRTAAMERRQDELKDDIGKLHTYMKEGFRDLKEAIEGLNGR